MHSRASSAFLWVEEEVQILAGCLVWEGEFA